MKSDTIETCALASGSNGNAYFFRTAKISFLIDAGISCRQLEKRLEKIGADISGLAGIFITHEHSDHIKGLGTLSKKYRVPLFINEKTLSRIRVSWDNSLTGIIRSRGTTSLGQTKVHALPKSHDVADPCLFTVSHGGKNIPVLTDLGEGCANAIAAIRSADVVYLETNYDQLMLKEGPYPVYVQNRIMSRNGHLSNDQAAALIETHATPRLGHIFLSHISENNNTPSLARRAVREALERRPDLSHVHVITTDRYGISEMLRLD